MEAVNVIWQGLRHLNHRGYVYIWANFAAVICSLPIITAPAAWAGLVKLSSEAYLSPGADLDDYWQGFRENLRRGVVVSLLNLVIVGVNITNLLAYRSQTDAVSAAMRIVWAGVLILWLVIQMYLFPILYQMKEPSLTGAMANALIMFYLNPIFTLVLVLALVVIAVLSTILTAAWLLLTLSVMAVLITGAVLNRLNIPLYQAEMLDEEENR